MENKPKFIHKKNETMEERNERKQRYIAYAVSKSSTGSEDMDSVIKMADELWERNNPQSADE